MDAFRILSRGGAKFDKKRFQNDVQLFNPAPSKPSTLTILQLQNGELPPELDFFKYAESRTNTDAKGKGKEKAPENKRDKKSKGGGTSIEEHAKSHKRKRKDGGDGTETEEDVMDVDGNEDPKEASTSTSTPIAHRITATGSNVPSPITSFEDLSERYNVPSRLLQNVSQNGYITPTGIQSQGVTILLESRDLVAISPTGTGKTLSYLLPLFSLLQSPSSSRSSASSDGTGVRALILSPTRELAGQIYNECLKLAEGRKWRIVLYSKATGATLAQKEVRDKIDVVISTPLRLVGALQGGNIQLDNVRHLVLDEADRLLEEGFLPQIEEIVSSCTHAKVQKAVFSATMPAGVETIAHSFMNDPIRVVIGLKDSAALNIKQSLTYVGTESGKLTTLRLLLRSSPPLPLLIFVQSRERATELHQELLYDGLSVDVLHSEMTRKQREESVSRMRRGETWVMVCTEVMARGMDFGGIKGVLNYDFPQSVQSYVHRIGRTGRAGREGVAITYFTDDDAPYLKSIANVLKQSNCAVPDYILALPKPSRMKKRMLKKKPVERKAVGIVAGRGIGKGDAVKRKQMIDASKRRKARETEEWSGVQSES